MTWSEAEEKELAHFAFLSRRPLPAELDRQAFVQAGSQLLEAVIRDEEA